MRGMDIHGSVTLGIGQAAVSASFNLDPVLATLQASTSSKKH